MEYLMDMGRIEGYEGKWALVVNGKVVRYAERAADLLKIAEEYSGDVIVTKILHAFASFY